MLPGNVKGMLTTRVDVKVQVLVNEAGKVVTVKPLNTSGQLGRFLGVAAANAARLWTFEPATIDERKVPGELTLEFAFVP